MNGSSNVLVLGVTGQVGKRVATNLKRKKATLSVGSRRKANLKELADQFGASRFIDLDDPRTFDEALNNVTSIFLITGYTVDMLVQSKSLIDAAKRNGVTHEFTSQHVYAEFPVSMVDQRWVIQRIYLQSHWVYCFRRCSRSCSSHSHGRAGKTQWNGLLVFSGSTYATPGG